jgi:hypothetical protein
MDSKKAPLLLVIVTAINAVFFSFQEVETILLSIVFIALGILILKLTVKRSALFLLSALALISVQTITFYMISGKHENVNLKEILINNSKWEWVLDDVNYSISIKNDSISFYDEKEFIDVFFFEIDDNKIYFNSKAGETFIWEIISAKNNHLKIKDDEDVILVYKRKI